MFSRVFLIREFLPWRLFHSFAKDITGIFRNRQFDLYLEKSSIKGIFDAWKQKETYGKVSEKISVCNSHFEVAVNVCEHWTIL